MRSIKNIFVGLLVAGVLAMGLVPNASALTSLDTGNNRTNIALRDEELVINDFETAFGAYASIFTSILGDIDEAELSERANNVAAANEGLQAKEFDPSLNDEFQAAVAEFKDAANTVTAAVKQTASKEYSNDAQIDAAIQELESASQSLADSTEKLEKAASEYEPGSAAWMIFLIGGIIVAVAIGITAIQAGKKNKKILASILGNDPEAAQLTKDQKRMIVRLYNDLVQYDQAMSQNNKLVLQGLEMGTYKKFTDSQNKEQYGRYAAFYYELDSLVSLNAQNAEKAKESAQKVASLRGPDSFVTARGRSLLSNEAGS